MKYLLIVFNSRNSVQAFSKLLKYNGIPFSVINTPRAISISCGLSIKISFVFYSNLIRLLNKSNNTIIGVYIFEKTENGESFQKIH